MYVRQYKCIEAEEQQTRTEEQENENRKIQTNEIRYVEIRSFCYRIDIIIIVVRFG